jgi:alkylation response protein AidB-like acyl-CoA dehydrogenase
MDIQFSDQDLAFKKEVQTFLAEAWTEDLETSMADAGSGKQARIEWQQRLFRRGWVAPGWPVEHGGTDWSPTQSYIWETERARVGAPDVSPFGLKMVGPVIYAFGSDEQKQRFLPRILNSEDWWCQGYSEPGAGSDLASLKTRAERDGDDYVVSGSKIWTTYAQYADWIFCLVRTDNSGRKQEGISFLLIDMTSPGITVKPIGTIDGHHSLNEVFFDQVRVPLSNLVGEENMGWTYAKSLLAHERVSIAGVSDSKRGLENVKQMALAEVGSGDSLMNNPLFAARVAEVEIELMALEYTELRALAAMAGGGSPGAESSLLKLKGTEIQQQVQELAMEVAGCYGGVIQGELNDEQLGHDHADAIRRSYMYGRASTIYGGSNEVQKNITAKYVLGL